jgi:hypothetical protein
LELWELERIKDKVEEMEGRLEVTIYAPDNTRYRVWYFPRDDVALYAKTVWDEDRRERPDKVSPGSILEALKNTDTKVRVRVKNDSTIESWFGSEPDMNPLDDVYRYTIHLT